MANKSYPGSDLALLPRWLDPDLAGAILAEFERGHPLAVWPLPLWTDSGQKILFYSREQLLAATRLPPGRWIDPTVTHHILAAADAPDCWPIILYAEAGTKPILFRSPEELLSATLPEE
jgi:hypothetical protein